MLLHSFQGMLCGGSADDDLLGYDFVVDSGVAVDTLEEHLAGTLAHEVALVHNGG